MTEKEPNKPTKPAHWSNHNLTINLDANPYNADWTKTHWSFPRYRSPEFFEQIAFMGLTLDQFKALPIYQFALERGFIVNDQWQGDDVIVGPWPNDKEGIE